LKNFTVPVANSVTSFHRAASPSDPPATIAA
jgi:hypothetical protein